MSTYQNINKENLSKLYSISCDSWKLKIADLLIKSKTSKAIKVPNDLITEAFNDANNSQKKLLKKYFKIVSPIDLFSKIKSYSDVCKALKEKEYTLKSFNIFKNPAKLLAVAQIEQIQRLFNGDWKPNWTNSSQYKWYPYFITTGSGGFRFHSCFYDCGGFLGDVGFYKDDKTAKFVGETFPDIYKKLL